jgi:single-strand DNA-binding protein
MPHSSINRVTLVGHLTTDPELRPLPSGDNVCNLRIACNGRRRTVDGGYETRPNYFSISVFGPQSDNVYRYLRKGRAVAVDGRLEWREWETADQQKRQAVTVVATDVQFLRGAGPGGAPRGGEDQEIDDLELLTATEGIEDELNSVEVELGNPVDIEEVVEEEPAPPKSERKKKSQSEQQSETEESESESENAAEPEPDLVAAGAGGEDGDLLF